MKFPLSLLKRFVQTDASVDEICRTLTAIGLEVDGLEDKAAALAPFVVAYVKEAVPHPNANKLRVCTVEAAQGTLQIVCGAPNARAGIKVALANIGTIIPTNGMEIKKSKIRDVESQGMLCSAAELGLSDDSEGIIELPADAKIGDSIVNVLGLDDAVIDLNITANRGDCLGVYGVARELAAAGLGTLKPLCMPNIPASGPCPVRITISDAEGCPAFLGRVIKGVKNGASPAWMQQALTAAGMRPISALVDITNYFSLAFGRPLHVYDLAKLQGGITVRTSREGETLAALNDKTYTLGASACVIADDAKVLGLGGIMGGSETGVQPDTSDVLLEVALFNPIRIAQTGRALQIDSDARARFERGVDAGFLEQAELRATDLILELCGGSASEKLLAGTIPTHRPKIAYDVAAISARGGIEIKTEKADAILKALGFTFEAGNAIPPSWRHDITIPEDIAEEVLRMVGYDAIPMVSLPKSSSLSKPALSKPQMMRHLARRVLAARQFDEVVSFGFISPKEAEMFGGQTPELTLQNPISTELSVMRPSLLPHLLSAAARNLSRGIAQQSLFELGTTFHAPRDERISVAAIRLGAPLHWQGSTPSDIYTIKADIAAILQLHGLDIAKLTLSREVPTWYHPGRAGRIALGGKNVLGTFGELHPAILKALDIETPVMAFELNMDALPLPKAAKRNALAASDYQPVVRDFAFVLDAACPAGDLLAAINKAEKLLIRDVTVFDVYQGKGVAEDKKSIAVSVTLQADDRTLTDAEIDAASKAIIASAGSIGAILR